MNLLNVCKDEKEKAMYKVIFEGASLAEYAKQFDVTPETARRQLKIMRQYFQHMKK